MGAQQSLQVSDDAEAAAIDGQQPPAAATGPPGPPPHPPPANHHLPPRITRTRTGCLMCRSRKKKCDERRPVCSGCARNGLSCTWPAVPPAQQRGGGGARDGAARQQQQHHHQQRTAPPPPPHSRNGAAIAAAVATLGGRGALRRGPGQACAALRIPGASLLFDHFLDSKRPGAAFKLLPGDAAVSAVAPLVLGDDMTMHALLALSASQMKASLPDAEIQARLHYGIAVKALKERVQRLADGRLVDLSGMLLAVMLLCNFEVNGGDVAGASAQHLQAARQMIRMCMKDVRASSDWGFPSFILDYYGYMSITSYVMAINAENNCITDPDTLVSTLTSLEELRTHFGFHFGLSYPVLVEVPRVARLTATRDGSIYEGGAEEEDNEEYDELEAAASASVSPESSSAASTASPDSPGTQGAGASAAGATGSSSSVTGSPPVATQQQQQQQQQAQSTPPPLFATAAMMLHQAALVVLYAMAHGERATDAALFARTDPAVDAFYALQASARGNRSVTASLMWPYILVGSCTRRREHRDALRAVLRASGFKPAFVATMIKLLEHIWDDPDPASFGPLAIRRALAAEDLEGELRRLQSGGSG